MGFGSMGQVYKAKSKTDNNWYAVKVLPRRSMWNVRLARRQVRSFAVPPPGRGAVRGRRHGRRRRTTWCGRWPRARRSKARWQQGRPAAPGAAAHFARQIAPAVTVRNQNKACSTGC